MNQMSDSLIEMYIFYFIILVKYAPPFFNANNFQILGYTWKKAFDSLFIKSNKNDFL